MHIWFSVRKSKGNEPSVKKINRFFRVMVTGSKIKILGESSYLYTMSIYDYKGRVIQTRSTNITGGTDMMTMQYGWSGLPLIIVHKQQKGTTNDEIMVTVTKNNYDNLSRVKSIQKKQSHSEVNGGAMSDYNTLSTLEYDALGQLKTKTLAPEFIPPSGGKGVETLVYDYNIRGWLLGANRDYARDANNTNYFGFDLGYDKINNNLIGGKSYAAAQYNGNIAGTVWKSKGDGEKRKYDFSYDPVNRLMKADFNQYTSGAFNKTAGVDFSMKMGDGALATSAYDANGNILGMTQNGLKLNSSPLIDQLTYTYQTNSNKLSKVVDAVNDNTSTLGDFKYDPLTKGSSDYSYDVNGNLTADANKNISSITYNHLNLPWVITVDNKGTITYTYDAAGNKQKKVTVDNTITPSKTTTTIYVSGMVYENDVLQFVAHEEGRIRPVKDEDDNITGFVYDYFIKDHLGNIRMVLTEEQKQNKYPVATLEFAKISTEQNYYNIYPAQVVSKSEATGIPNYINDNGIGNNPEDAAFSATNSTKLYKLNSNEAKTGLGITLKVMAGDKIDVLGKSYYFQNTTGTSGNNPLPVLDLLTAFLSSPSSAVIAGHGALSPEILNTPSGVAGITSMIAHQTSQSNGTPTKPRAFINVLFFDEQFKATDFKISMAGDNSTLKDHFSELQNLAATKNGYVYIYCSNESPVNVYFDNLQVVHTPGAILEETHYYPFGLTMAGISSRVAGGLENKIKFGGKELQSKEFSDGSGLELYNFHARQQDPQIGRWTSVDPLADKFSHQSPYVVMDNNPINIIDPTGMSGTSTHTDKNGKVIAVYHDGDLGVYKHGDNANGKAPTEANIDKRHNKSTSAGGEKMGETENWDEFVSPETGKTLTETTIQFGKSFDPVISEMNEKAKGMDLIDIAMESRPGGDFDIKKDYKNVGGLLNAKYATSRSAGNFLAGYNAESGTYLGAGISFTTFQKLAGALHLEGSHGKNLGKGQMLDIVLFGTYNSSDFSKFVAPTYGEVNYQYRMSITGWNFGKKK